MKWFDSFGKWGKDSGLAHGAYRLVIACERGGAGSIGSRGSKGFKGVGAAHKNQKRRGVLTALRAAVIESVAEGLSCTAVSIT